MTHWMGVEVMDQAAPGPKRPEPRHPFCNLGSLMVKGQDDLLSFSKDGKADLYTSEVKWPELLDWATYHAPGEQEWREFRAELRKMPMGDRAPAIALWWKRNEPGPENDRLAAIVRIHWLMRTMGRQTKTDPALLGLKDRFSKLLKEAWR